MSRNTKKTFDAYDKLISEIVYDDNGNRKEVWIPNPSSEDSSPALIISQKFEYNAKNQEKPRDRAQINEE